MGAGTLDDHGFNYDKIFMKYFLRNFLNGLLGTFFRSSFLFC